MHTCCPDSLALDWARERATGEPFPAALARLWSTLEAERPASQHVMADGMCGQFVYVDRPRRVVVVKTSAWPYDDAWSDQQCRDLCYLALPAIADVAIAG